MKKIFFVDGLRNRSAAQNFVFLWDINLQKKDYKLDFLTSAYEDIPWPYGDPPTKLIKIWSKGHYVRKLYKFFKNNNPDLVHFFFELRTFGTLKSAIKFPFLLFLLRMMNTKIVVTLYNPLIFKKNSEWSIVKDFPLSVPKSIMKILVNIFIKTVSKYSDKIVVQVDTIKSGLIEYFGINNEKIIVINSGIPQEQDKLSLTKKEEFLQKFQGKKIIFCFGAISPRKGQMATIQAFNMIRDQLPDHILVIAGRAPADFKAYETELKNTINTLELQDRVLYIGVLENEEINILFDAADMSVWAYLPAIYGAGAFTFAAQYNTPSIVTKIDTFRDILGGKGALFIEPENIEQLASAIKDLGTNMELRNKIKKELKEITTFRSCENMAAQHFDIYQKLLKQD